MKANRDAGHPQALRMKAWDLRKAYKQLPLHESSLDESFLCVYDPGSRTAKIFGQLRPPLWSSCKRPRVLQDLGRSMAHWRFCAQVALVLVL